MKKAIVTLATDRYVDVWRVRCRRLWQHYATAHGYDVICFDGPLDESARARSRSPAWQKLLILEQADVRRYDRVVWIDADVVINAEVAPCVVVDTPAEKIGIVAEMALFDNPMARHRRASFEALLRRREESQGVATGPGPYAAFGLTPSFPELLNTGVMVLSPRHHAELLRHVYDTYEDKGAPGYNFEMRPLSHEILKRGLHHPIDPRFNVLWVHYIHVFHPRLDRARRFFTGIPFALGGAYLNSFFLHFAGRQSDMDYLSFIGARDGSFFLRARKLDEIAQRIIEELKASKP